MKATQGTTYRMLGSRLNDISQQLEDLRNIGATGKKLNRPSDNPSAIRPVFDTRKQISNVDRDLNTMGQALDTMQATDGYLNSVENTMQRAKEIMTNAANGSLNDQDRTTLADELSQLSKQLLDTSNGMVDGKYLFGGYKVDTIPFTENPTYTTAGYVANDPNTWPVKYNGDGNATSLEITTGQQVQVNLTGSDLFFGTAAWDPADPTKQQLDSGRYNLFTELKQAEEALRDPNQATRDAAIQTSLTDLEGAANQNRQLRSQLGNRTNLVQTTMTDQQGVNTDLKAILSRYQDADAIEAFNNITQQETAFQAALSVTGQVSKLSILDYI
jgi:flagellar hook-associated protein 3 FlgL